MRFCFFFVFCGSNRQYTSKLLLGLENRLKTKVFTCIKKITKMRLMRYWIMKIKRFFDIFRLGRPRVANLTPGIDSLRNFTSIIHFWSVFEKLNFLKNKHLADFVFGSDNHIMLWNTLHFYNKCFKTHREVCFEKDSFCMLNKSKYCIKTQTAFSHRKKTFSIIIV